MQMSLQLRLCGAAAALLLLLLLLLVLLLVELLLLLRVLVLLVLAAALQRQQGVMRKPDIIVHEVPIRGKQQIALEIYFALQHLGLRRRGRRRLGSRFWRRSRRRRGFFLLEWFDVALYCCNGFLRRGFLPQQGLVSCSARQAHCLVHHTTLCIQTFFWAKMMQTAAAPVTHSHGSCCSDAATGCTDTSNSLRQHSTSCSARQTRAIQENKAHQAEAPLSMSVRLSVCLSLCRCLSVCLYTAS